MVDGNRVRFAAIACALSCFFVLGQAEIARAELGSAREGWSPAIRWSFGAHVQGLDGNVEIPDGIPLINEPSTDPDVDDFRIAGSGGDSANIGEMRYGIRLYTPTDLLGSGEYAPRIFFQGSFEDPMDDQFFASRYNEIFDANPTDPDRPRAIDSCPGTGPPPANPINAIPCEYAAQTKVDILYNWNIGFGVDFRLPVMEGQFHLTPTLEYFGQAIQVEGSAIYTIANTATAQDVRAIRISGERKNLHGIGTGLGLEVDVLQRESFNLRIFFEGRAAWIISDREFKFSGLNPVPTPGFNSANFSVRPSGFLAKVAAGLELRFKGPF